MIPLNSYSVCITIFHKPLQNDSRKNEVLPSQRCHLTLFHLVHLNIHTNHKDEVFTVCKPSLSAPSHKSQDLHSGGESYSDNTSDKVCKCLKGSPGHYPVLFYKLELVNIILGHSGQLNLPVLSWIPFSLCSTVFWHRQIILTIRLQMDQPCIRDAKLRFNYILKILCWL